MASTRRTRNVNKRFAKANEEWHEKDGSTTNKKRKLSDMLGSQWGKDELERFYEAYRKYGKDWKKVAGSVRNNRSVDMVKALYNMNKAYLSLPEGATSTAGLIAMMTDHYNILDGVQSDQESADLARAYRKPQKRSRGKLKQAKSSNGPFSDLLQHPSSSDYGFLSFSKKQQSGDIFASNRPRAVGKRTPRVPVSNEHTKVSPAKYCVTSDASLADDEGVHVAALALAEALNRGGSPQVSHTPLRRADRFKASPAMCGDRKNVEVEMVSSKFAGLDGDYPEGSLGSREAENAYFTREDNNVIESEGTDAIEVHQNFKKPRGKKAKSLYLENDHFDDEREACSATEEGASVRRGKNDKDIEAVDSKPERTTKSSRRRSRQLFCGDEKADNLQTLADLSLNMLLPSSAVESESSVKVKDEKNDDSANEKPNLNESASNLKDGSKILGKTKGPSAVSGVDIVTRRCTKPLKRWSPDSKGRSEIKESVGASKSKKRGRPWAGKLQIAKLEHKKETHVDGSKTVEVSVEEVKRPSVKARKGNQGTPPPKQGKLIKAPDGSPSSPDLGVVNDLNVKNEQITTSKRAVQSNIIGSRRKKHLQKVLGMKEFKLGESVLEEHPDKHAFLACNKSSNQKETLSHCLLSRLLRRWCVYEWFYSAIDYPWFAKSEFLEYLNHVGLGHVPRLTRVEWGVIRSSLGKPRRLSKHFLQEEREKLEKYRESVRTTYAELRVGLREGLPTDLARPLSVGQRVIACHPKTRDIHDGFILTVDRNRCRVQFDREELGVELVMDIDCMPLNPSENIPENMRRQNAMTERFTSFMDTKMDDQMKDWNLGGPTRSTSCQNSDVLGVISLIASNYSMSNLIKQAKEDTVDATMQAKAAASEFAVVLKQEMYNKPCTLAQIQAKEADIRALAELNCALDKKQGLLMELKHMNEVSGKQNDGNAINDLEHFRKQYAIVLCQLRDVNDQVASALLYLRQRNSYHVNTAPLWLNTVENSEGPAGSPESFNPAAFVARDAGSRVVEIIETSRRKARAMVGVAVQAISTVKDEEDAFLKIGEALDFPRSRNPLSGTSTVRQAPPESGPGDPDGRDHAASGVVDPATPNVGGARTESSPDASEAQVPSELISSCVSTLLMIQACTERQYPPAEVAQILDSAVASLQPCCPQNVPIYREIESCMGIIKNQMLALIPTPIAAPPAGAGM